MIVWAVIEDSYGAHETDAVWSLWTALELAEAERARLLADPEAYRSEDGAHFHIVEVMTDTPRDIPIESR